MSLISELGLSPCGAFRLLISILLWFRLVFGFYFSYKSIIRHTVTRGWRQHPHVTTCKHKKDSIFALCRDARCVIMAQIATRQGRGVPRGSQSGGGRDDRSSPWENTFRNRLKEFQRKEEEETELEDISRPRTVRERVGLSVNSL